MLNCVIVDDEPLAREGLAGYVQLIDFLNLVGTAEHPLDVLKLLETQPIDLLFLDIQMPHLSGLELLRMLTNPPVVILTTAYPQFALEAFGLSVLDYLLKPILFDRFLKAAHKAQAHHRLLTASGSPSGNPDRDYVFIKCGTKYERIRISDILFVEGLQNYVTIQATVGRYVTLLPMKRVEEQLTHRGFLRTHKSYLVATDKIDGISGHELSVGEHRIPVSRQLRDEVMQTLLQGNLW
ncbi:MAG: DNA-binding response regulator [Cytophagales bacterium]|nr:MAG: DNA-binding response regulator [Cytophagales bacterium]